MFDMKIRVSTSLVGTTGYNNHAQSFFKALSRLVPLEVRNFTIGKSWKGYSDEPHNDEPYMDDEFKKILVDQALWEDKELKDFPIYTKYPNPGKAAINLVMNETDHHFFYSQYSGYKIAFNVWESTLQPENFFKKLLEFDEMWVPSKWQKDCTIKQGYPEDKIFVIPEGVDHTTFYPDENAKHVLTSNPKRFTFGIFGRWDYRKSTKEMIETFLKTFDKSEPVDLIVSIDNPFCGDNLKSTEARLEHYGLMDSRIKILHLPPREDYVKLLKSMNVFLSCSRSEGWNLPLIEAMACGTPSIYSDCCAQLEFAEGRGLPVKVLGEKAASDQSYNHFNPPVGNYYEPDFDDLGRVMRDAYENYKTHKEKAIADSVVIRDNFNWERVAQLASDHLESRRDHIAEVISKNPDLLRITYHCVDGPHVQITGGDPGQFLVQFINEDTGLVEYQDAIKNNMYCSYNKKYYVNWRFKVVDMKTAEVLLDEVMNLKDKRVYISIDSVSLGDTLAWFPPMIKFKEKHGCKLVASTFHNEWYEKNYPDVEFVKPGTLVTDLFAMYNLGWHYNEKGEIDLMRVPTDPRPLPMQQAPFDELGLEFEETKPILNFPKVPKKKQIAIAIHATCQAKYWNRYKGWDEVVDWCRKQGYQVVLLSREEPGFMRNPHPQGIRQLKPGTLEELIPEMLASQAFVGIGSGLSWLAWALDVPTVLISGFSEPYTEASQNTYRVSAPEGKCTGCFNRYRLNAGDWNWCPDHYGTERHFECTRSITPEMVIDQLKKILKIV